MTEAEWLTCQVPEKLIAALGRKASKRKRRLLACAFCYRVKSLVTDERGLATLTAAEQFADGLINGAELEQYERAAKKMRYETHPGHLVFHAREACVVSASKHAGDAVKAGWYVATAKRWQRTEENGLTPEDPSFKFIAEEAESKELAEQATLFREIFGNTLRPVSLSPSWRTDTAVALATQMYQSREFSAMPILADALQDAGCDSADILEHCRSKGPHVRGCWVVDLVLGKE